MLDLILKRKNFANILASLHFKNEFKFLNVDVIRAKRKKTLFKAMWKIIRVAAGIFQYAISKTFSSIKSDQIRSEIRNHSKKTKVESFWK